MTLVLSLLRDDVAIHISDRRLTSAGSVRTDEANKAFTIITNDGRLAMGYSGLAQIETQSGVVFDMEQRAIDLLIESGPPDYRWKGMSERFGRRLSALFTGPPFQDLDPDELATSIHFIGFLNGAEGPLPTSTFVSNHNDPARQEWASPPAPEFRVTTRHLEPGGHHVQALGTYRHISKEDMAPLVSLFADGEPPDAIVAKGVEVFREWADRPQAHGVIGKQISSIVLPADFDAYARGVYHPAIAQPTSFGVMNVVCRSDQTFAWKPELTEVDGGLAAVPKVGRNVPCPCGSGLKYKRCHGG